MEEKSVEGETSAAASDLVRIQYMHVARIVNGNNVSAKLWTGRSALTRIYSQEFRSHTHTTVDRNNSRCSWVSLEIHESLLLSASSAKHEYAPYCLQGRSSAASPRRAALPVRCVCMSCALCSTRPRIALAPHACCAFFVFLFGKQDASTHDGDWNYYKRQAHERNDVIGQLASLLETYGCNLPKVSWRPSIERRKEGICGRLLLLLQCFQQAAATVLTRADYSMDGA